MYAFHTLAAIEKTQSTGEHQTVGIPNIREFPRILSIRFEIRLSLNS